MTSQLAIIYHELAVLLDAGVPVLKSLNIISEGLKGRMKIIFSDLSKSVSQGNTFADSMTKHTKAFARLDLMLIKSAEHSGELPNCFKMLSNWYEFKTRLKRIFISRCILSGVVLHIAIVIFPLVSLILGRISTSEFLINIAITLGSIYLLITIPLILYRSMPDTGILRRLFDTLILRIPILGQGVWQNSISRYCKGFTMLYEAGLPISQCATQATELTGNLIVADIFKGAEASIKEGKMAYEGFSRKLPLDYLNLWQTGEQTGELEKMSGKIAEISGDRAELLFTEFARWLPILIYVIVCFFMIIQIFKLAQGIGSSYTVIP